MTARVRAGAVVAMTGAALLLPAGAAAAAEPERAGWWNRASAGGVSLPQPLTQPGDLRIVSGPDAPTAYSALLYSAPGSTAAVLELAVREGSAVGTAEVAACPTVDGEWPDGGNQPYDKAPEYDCAIGMSAGTVSDDGTTLSFDLDSSTQLEDGVWSLALVPQPDGSGAPFALDVEKPGPEAFVPEQQDPATDDGTTSAGGAPPSADTTGTGTGGAFVPGGFDSAVPALAGAPLASAPLVAGGEPLTPAAAPVPAAPSAVALPLVARPAGVVEDLGAGRRLLALLVLVGGSAAVGYAAGQQRPGPRLIGGRSRLVPPADLPAVPAPSAERPRGIGRFAKARDAAPRRLR